MPIWLLLSLLAATIWAIGQVAAKKGLAHISPLWNNIFANAFALVIWIPTVLLLSNFHIVTPSLPILLAIFLGAGAYMLFFYAVSKGDISLTGSLSALYPVSTVIFSYIFLHERISVVQEIGILVALCGVIMISLPVQNLTQTISHHMIWVVWGIGSAIISGFGDFLAKLASNAVGSYSQIFYAAVLFQVLSLGNFLIDKKGRTLPKFSFKKFFPSLLGTCFAILGTMIFYLAFHYGPVSLIAPASSIYPGIVVLLAWIFLKERVTRRQLGGVFGIIIGIMLLGFGGN
jgi:drug/metabolite transporter (DMT)-like permease